jgi:hypothetical protein
MPHPNELRHGLKLANAVEDRVLEYINNVENVDSALDIILERPIDVSRGGSVYNDGKRVGREGLIDTAEGVSLVRTGARRRIRTGTAQNRKGTIA